MHEQFSRCLFSTKIPYKTHLGTSDGPPLPTSFEAACADTKWAAAIDREYEALIRRGTWEYLKHTTDMCPAPYKWTFRANQIDDSGTNFLHKARCVISGDIQEPYQDFDPDNIYTPVATHETLRIFFAYVAAKNLFLEGAEAKNAYLHSKLDIHILVQQSTNSSGVLAEKDTVLLRSSNQAEAGSVSLLRRSLYGARKAGIIWGSFIAYELKTWGLSVSKCDPRLYFLRVNDSFIFLLFVADNTAFSSNDHLLLEKFKKQLQDLFYIELYGDLKTFNE